MNTSLQRHKEKDMKKAKEIKSEIKANADESTTESTKSNKNKISETKTSKMILSPRITEKASMQSMVNAYTFVVAPNATKLEIVNEIKREYKVTPKKVNITNLPVRNVVVRNKKGRVAGIKKAIVFLKKGDTIKLS